MITLTLQLTEKQFVRASDAVASVVGHDPTPEEISAFLLTRLGNFVQQREQAVIDAAIAAKTVPTVQAF